MKFDEEVQILTSELHSNDGAQRERARSRLVEIGKPATESLIRLLASKDEQIRWEACKALVSIRDPLAAGALVEALRDSNVEVRWLAAEALIALGKKALVPLMQALKTHFDSVLLRQGAYHVLNELERTGLLDRKSKAVLNSLRSSITEAPVATTAHEALSYLTRSK